MKLLYLAGPYRGATAWAIHRNIMEALDVGADVVRLLGGEDWFPVIPQANTQHFDGLAPDEYFLDGTLELLRRCDAVLMLPGWELSAGAAAERAEAERLGIPVYESLRDVPGLGIAEWGRGKA
jgi:hypothetical protein